ncbi:YciI family protein [Actinophytocola gossypii]|uniref:YciI family protein n=1 Tax=Actinophytocola gossypii TaxID=2812003 RepID=A0ABT2J6I5_9PSEU|nr:YciI family protein [Actinophytocola gossypii]MCT2583398.1 YciI family protein [Actinophytocola gossypii]
MRYMVMVKYAENDPNIPEPDEEMYAEMARYNEELVKAGVMLAGEGLHPSDQGALVTFRNGVPTVTDGPFAEGKELVGGYWLLEAKSREEVLEWVKRIPADPNVTSRVEVRQLAD